MKQGTILTRESTIPLIKHVGIISYENGVPLVYNNTPSLKNEFGGSIVAVSLNDFMMVGELISEQETNLNANYIRNAAYILRYKTYSALFYNCEDFISELLSFRKGSPQRTMWMWWVGLSITGYGIYRAKR